jgi:hypothetical protein
MSRLAALNSGTVHLAPISHTVVPPADERCLQILKIDPFSLIVDALWTLRRLAEESAQVVQNVLRAYTLGSYDSREGSREIIQDHAQVHENR